MTIPFDEVAHDIGDAGAQLTALGACEGAAGNASVFAAALAGCPLEATSEVDLPVPAPALAGGWVVITASGRRLRDVGRRPAETLVALRIHGDGRRATRHGAGRPSTDFNSHLAVHDHHRARRGVERHAIVHAQPPRTVFLSHLADVRTGEELTRRLSRWQPETAMVLPDGIALTPFHPPGSPEQMAVTLEALAGRAAAVWARHGIITRSDASATHAADLVEYVEAAAVYEVMNLSAGSPC